MPLPWPLNDKKGRMTPEQHNRYLGLSHLAFGGLFGLAMLAFIGFFTVIFATSSGPGQGDLIFIVFAGLFMTVFYGIFMIPSFVAGYALLKRKSWARTAAIIGGVMAAMSFPVGTAVCVYTFWFLFSEPGKSLYDKQPALPPPPPSWSAAIPARGPSEQRGYVPPVTPPDWR